MAYVKIITRYDSACHECDTTIDAGDPAILDTSARVVYCMECEEDLDHELEEGVSNGN